MALGKMLDFRRDAGVFTCHQRRASADRPSHAVSPATPTL